MTRNDAREIVRHLQDGDPERGFRCVVSHREAGGPCERPPTMAVYGLNFCEVHGEECANGAFEELHQDAHDFFDRFDGDHVLPLSNPWVLRAVREWRSTVPAGELDHEKRVEELLLRAFPFRAELVYEGSAEEIADPIEGAAPPYDTWRDDRHDVHAMMRAAYGRGMTWLVENLEEPRQSIAAQCAYALALTRGEHPEVLERAHKANIESAREVAERFARRR